VRAAFGLVVLRTIIPQSVMAGLVPAIHTPFSLPRRQTWMPGTSAGMTSLIKNGAF
jgi:hypothetical protein